MGITANIHDPHREEMLKRIRDTAKGPEGKDKVKSDYNIDVSKGQPLPGELPNKQKQPNTNK